MHIKSQKDFFAGLIHAAVGVGFVGASTNYAIGDGARMGPGYFPLALGVALTALGGIAMFRALVMETLDGQPIGPWAWRPLVLIVAASLAFGLLLAGLPSLGVPALGLAAAIGALVILSALAGPQVRWIETLILAALLAIGGWVVLVWWLKLPFQGSPAG